MRLLFLHVAFQTTPYACSQHAGCLKFWQKSQRRRAREFPHQAASHGLLTCPNGSCCAFDMMHGCLFDRLPHALCFEHSHASPMYIMCSSDMYVQIHLTRLHGSSLQIELTPLPSFWCTSYFFKMYLSISSVELIANRAHKLATTPSQTPAVPSLSLSPP